MAVLRSQRSTGFGEGWGKAAAIVSQHMSETEGKGRCRLTQEGNGAWLGLVILDREMNGAGAAIDRDVKEALAPLPISGLELGQVLDVDVHEAEVIVFEGALALGGPVSNGLWPAVQAFRLEDAPDAVAIEMRQEVGDHESEIIEGEVGGRRRAQTTARSSSVAFHGR
jgi:hypothetical protein